MRRRNFMTVLAGAVAAWPIAALAQQPKVSAVGVLVRSADGWEQFWQLFPQELRELGYVEGKNIRFEFRSDEGQVSRLPELAAELVRLKVDVIVTWFTSAAKAAKQATSEIPIVMALVGNPIESGLVESLARPGGNVTGLAGVGGELCAKSVELVRVLMPSARRVTALVDMSDAFSETFAKYTQSAIEATGTSTDPILIHGSDELENAFSAMAKAPPDAIIVQPTLAKRAAKLALSYRIPAISIMRAFAFDGGLMSYYSSEKDQYRRAAVFVDKILKGAKPAELPVEQPTKFELVINIKTAKALGIDVPPALILRADDLIE
jgi:putative tryptophan/tyrosine transport system substrate-binding protein